MNPEMDDGRILAQLERCLAQDDPDLASLMDALNEQFPDEGAAQSPDGHEEGHEKEEKQRNWWMTAVTVFVAIAFLGLFLTAVLNSSPQSAEEDTGPPRGPGAGMSTQSERRSQPRTSPRQRGPGQGSGHRPTDGLSGGIRART
ncbi:DUF3040 domain-containing protein [Streptomyces sp. NPDC006527]|uniref:DUF3040 domain-containing protein n=1 Tax=Streptomyces sp. NPDC006527 TaxID=3364749 RepID=UPI003684050E